MMPAAEWRVAVTRSRGRGRKTIFSMRDGKKRIYLSNILEIRLVALGVD